MKAFHVSMKIQSAREHWHIFNQPYDDVMKELDRMESEGKKLIKAEGCDNFDYKTGCRGHKS